MRRSSCRLSFRSRTLRSHHTGATALRSASMGTTSGRSRSRWSPRPPTRPPHEWRGADGRAVCHGVKTDVLYYGDNLEILRKYVPDGSVDLVYLYPPFNSNRDYNVIFKDESGR